MTSRDRLARASEQFGEEMVATFERLEVLRGDIPAPRTTQSLVDDAAVLGLAHDSVVADVGAWGGLWSERLSARYGCRCIALDLSPTGLARGSQACRPRRHG